MDAGSTERSGTDRRRTGRRAGVRRPLRGAALDVPPHRRGHAVGCRSAGRPAGGRPRLDHRHPELARRRRVRRRRHRPDHRDRRHARRTGGCVVAAVRRPDPLLLPRQPHRQPGHLDLHPALHADIAATAVRRTRTGCESRRWTGSVPIRRSSSCWSRPTTNHGGGSTANSTSTAGWDRTATTSHGPPACSSWQRHGVDHSSRRSPRSNTGWPDMRFACAVSCCATSRHCWRC